MGKSSGRVQRADLHVHTRHSRLEIFPVLGARDCYSAPREVYRRAKARGMDLVTFTDHDTIDGCLELLDEEGELSDFFISEEVSSRDPRTGCRLHVSVYAINEEQHAEIQRLRDDIRVLLSYLDREAIPVALNHIASSLPGGSVPVPDLVDLAAAFPLLETRNGAQGRQSNHLASGLAELLERGGTCVGRTGGSDAHTCRRVGWAWTEAAARDRDSFLTELRNRRVFPRGESARLHSILGDVYDVVLAYYRDLAGNANGHFAPGKRWKAAGCALLSLPLHLVALPALGTLIRRAQVGGTARRYAAALAEAGERAAGMPPGGRWPRSRPGLLEMEIPAVPGGWVPRPGSEEA